LKKQPGTRNSHAGSSDGDVHFAGCRQFSQQLDFRDVMAVLVHVRHEQALGQRPFIPLAQRPVLLETERIDTEAKVRGSTDGARQACA